MQVPKSTWVFVSLAIGKDEDREVLFSIRVLWVIKVQQILNAILTKVSLKYLFTAGK